MLAIARTNRLTAGLLGCAALLLAGCAGKPPAPPPADPKTYGMPPPVALTLERFQKTFEPGVVLDYQVEQKLSRVNGRACYAYITGVLYNRSSDGISKKTGLDVTVFSQGVQLFRDQSYPVADLTPGMGAAIEMVISPVHPDGCPKYDRIHIVLRKIPL